jgi:hypothetical protein
MSLANLVNITIDDFDPVVVYSNPGDWSTPNPQDHPSWYNASRELTGSIWHQCLYDPWLSKWPRTVFISYHNELNGIVLFQPPIIKPTSKEPWRG